MKLIHLLNMLGYRGKPKRFGHEVVTYDFPTDGQVKYARWLHPKNLDRQIDQQHVDNLRQWISPGDTVIDIGAHSGDTSITMGLAAGPAGHTFAFEPNPYAFDVLKVNASLNPDKANIIPYNLAATEADGDFEFCYSDAGYCNGGLYPKGTEHKHRHYYTLDVQGKNIAALLSEQHPDAIDKLSYIKIDTEGYDRFVIQTLRGLIAARKPVIRSEVMKCLNKQERHEQLGLIESLGYDMFKYDDDSGAAGPRVKKADAMKWEHYDVLATPRA